MFFGARNGSEISKKYLVLPLNQQTFSPVMILKITSKIVLDIRECKRIFSENFILFMQKIVSTRREKRTSTQL